MWKNCGKRISFRSSNVSVLKKKKRSFFFKEKVSLSGGTGLTTDPAIRSWLVTLRYHVGWLHSGIMLHLVLSNCGDTSCLQAPTQGLMTYHITSIISVLYTHTLTSPAGVEGSCLKGHNT